jgi:glycosyltransferase involved in cell wall biosynthesis
MNPKISIALITYNGEKYIREQLDSIFNQTIQDFDIVVCDDCSTDSTKEILFEYADKDPRVVLNFNEKNLGFLRNIEKTIKLCKGEFIALADQDDIWEKEHLSVLHSNIGENFLICGDTLYVDKDNNSLNIKLSQAFKIDIDSLRNNDEHLLRSLVMSNIFQGAAMMINRKFTDFIIPFPNKIEYHDWWLALCAMALNKFVYVPIVIIRHRRHNSNASSDVEFVEDIVHFYHKKEYAMALINLPNLNETSRQIIERSNQFFVNKINKLNYHKAIWFWIKNYRILYATNSKSRFLKRFLTIFFYHPLRNIVNKIK